MGLGVSEEKPQGKPEANHEVISFGGGGEIELELHGLRILKVQAVKKDKGAITFALTSPPPAPSSRSRDSSSEGLALGAEIEGRVVLFTKASVLADIGRSKFARLNVTVDVAARLRCGEELALVVEDTETDRSVVALAPALAEEVAGRVPSRTPMAGFEVGMELDGYVQSLASEGVFLDVHGVRSVVLPWRHLQGRKMRGRKRPRVGDRVRLKVTRVDAAREQVNVAMLGGVR